MLWDIVIDTFSTEDEKKQLRIRNAGGVIAGSGVLATECRNAISAAGGISSLVPRVPSNEVTKCPNDVLVFTMENAWLD